ncbi:hypothetical protein B0T19DRAFT_419328 [Cercophora scortea]|uniref:Uncharacterized protein n=1 Tax=Cercophora scortea TaxID=314031 RepID=A0AAE0IZP8_9PEZI|nr:hypothetical protein B0T19DRAFT_419328 [Cercophora scortea]
MAHRLCAVMCGLAWHRPACCLVRLVCFLFFFVFFLFSPLPFRVRDLFGLHRGVCVWFVCQLWWWRWCGGSVLFWELFSLSFLYQRSLSQVPTFY